MPLARPVRDRSVFSFPEKMAPERRGADEGVLLWRILQTQPEVRGGRVHLMRQRFFQLLRDPDEGLSLRAGLIRSIHVLIQKSGRSRLQDPTAFVMRVASQLRRELMLLQDPSQRCALDILFQTIQLISLNPSRAEADQVIQSIGTHHPHTSISVADRESLQRNFRAYIFLAGKVVQIKSLRQTLDLRDELIAATAQHFPQTSVYVLDCMLRYIVAQLLLARKYRCDTLIVEWLKEYGFGPEHMVRIAQYIPYETAFLRFRTSYRNAIRDLKNYAPPTARAEDSDEFLLRSLSIFYTSWIMKTSEQLPVH